MHPSPKLSPRTALLLLASVAFFICYAFVVPPPEAKHTFFSIEKLLKEDKLKVSIKGLGGHQQECVEFDLKNLSGDTLFLQIEPGRRLHSEDTTAQDILIVKTKQVILPPHAATTVNGFGFCCKSHHHSPAAKSVFKIGTMAPESWQKVARAIDQKSFDTESIQAAVWSMSNDHPLSAIPNHDLRKIVADIKGIEAPWYTVGFAESADQLFSGKHQLFTGDLKYSVSSNTMISMLVKNETGQTVKTLLKAEAKGAGEYESKLNFSVAGWPKGKYQIYVYENFSNLNKKVGFEL
jgi:hypothetical protein